MVQFVAFDKKVEVNKRTVLAIVNSMAYGRDVRIAILKRNGINIKDGSTWYSQQAWLNAFKEIANSLGDMHLFLIGNAIIDNAEFPAMYELEDALRSIDVAYHMNHRLDGEIMYNKDTNEMTEGIGHYALELFDATNKKAVMVCNNPYPSKFDEGIIAQVARRFSPSSAQPSVDLDMTKETRVRGGEACTFNLRW